MSLENEQDMWTAIVVNDVPVAEYRHIEPADTNDYNATTDEEHLRAECDYAAQKALDERGEPFSDWQGVVGEKIVVEDVTITMTRITSGAYGPTVIVKFVDQYGCVYVWFSGSDAAWDMTEGDTFTFLTGTVKKHDTFNGVRQTVLTRVKVG